MATVEGIADVLGCSGADVEPVVAGLVEQAQAEALSSDRFRLLPEAVAEVDEQFRVDAVRLASVIEQEMEEFHQINSAFKEVVTAWQLRKVDGEVVPNDHDDADYDAAVIARLRSDIHARIVPMVAAVASSEPRLARYGERLEAALVAIEGGDTQMVAHPLRDSYHTVRFELHEELICLSGRNRADEAAAGRA